MKIYIREVDSWLQCNVFVAFSDASQRKVGVKMNGLTIMLIAIVVLGGAYLLYGRWLAKKWGIDPKAKTPAYELEDGVD